MEPFTTFRLPGEPEIRIAANGEGLTKGFELARLVAIEYWYQKTCNEIWDANGSQGSIFDLPDNEVHRDYDRNVFNEIRSRFVKCPSLQDAIDHIYKPYKDHGVRHIDILKDRSCVWHTLIYIEKLFLIRFFDWVELAVICSHIADIAMADGEVDDLVAKVNEIIGIWHASF
ncbi:MAG: hypothetical protein M3Q07_10545 [Pseudobdellovibrionaceae bacterium]|nr:hypothetical protein [Pseudobdellovibrionaceae bacterium]